MVRVDTADPRLDDPTPYREVDLLEAIARKAADQDLTLDLQPAIGVMRPDLIVRRDQLPLLVVELKREQGTIHFAGISQVTAYANALEALSEYPVHPVLISTGEATNELTELAETLGVHLISVYELNLEDAAERCVGLLTNLAERQEREIADRPAEGHELLSSLALLRNQLAHGKSSDQISAELKIGPTELKNLYMTLLTKLEATEPDRLDALMRAWERTD